MRRPRAWAIAGALLAGWLLWPLLPIHDRPALRVDMLAVGDGSCFVVRSGGETFVFDAGSSTDLNAGRRSLVPALRGLNIHTIDAIAVSHPNLDHYSAVLELADAFRVKKVYVTPQLMDAAREDPFAAVAYLVDGLTTRRIAVQVRTAGDREPLGEAHLSWLHPDADDVYERNNNTSMVIRAQAGRRSILLTGDIQPEAIGDLLARHPDLNTDVVELPHHGSFNEAAARLIRRLHPKVTLQSTGWYRWERDRWSDALTGVERLVTARDGACWVEIGDEGAITTGRFIETPP